MFLYFFFFFFFQAEDGIRDLYVTGVQTCALPISDPAGNSVSVWTTPETQITRTASGAARFPRPNRRSAGATAGVAAEVSSFWRRLPARMSTLAPIPPLFETRPARRRANERFALPPS